MLPLWTSILIIYLHSNLNLHTHDFVLLKPGTPLHIAAKERNRDAVKFLVENGAFLPPDMNDSRFNPPLHYCPGLEWAYEEMKRLRQEDLSPGETSCSSEN
jgi:ankyrin repeat protein